MGQFEDILMLVQQKLKELEALAGEDKEKKQKLLAEQVKAYRLANHLTLDEMAKRLFVTKMCVIRWEKGEVMPTDSNLARFRDLGITKK